MECAAYRRAVLADPRDADPGLREHRVTCHDCTAFTERLTRFESRLERALRVSVAPVSVAPMPVPVPVPVSAQRRPLAAHYRRGWLAMAASVLLAVAVVGGVWLSGPDRSLAADVVTHMGGEPQAWRRTDVPVPAVELDDVLRGSGVSLSGGAGMVSYASSCEFRGYHVPHLVLQTGSGPVTVMVLVHEPAARSVRFDEPGYRGVIVPVAGHGSLAVLTRGQDTDIRTVELIAAQVLNSIVWTGQG